MVSKKPDWPGGYFWAMLPVAFVLWLAVGAAVAALRGNPISNALYAALISALAPWKLTLLFVPTRTRNRTRIYVCGVLGIAIFAALIAIDFLGKGLD